MHTNPVLHLVFTVACKIQPYTPKQFPTTQPQLTEVSYPID